MHMKVERLMLLCCALLAGMMFGCGDDEPNTKIVSVSDSLVWLNHHDSVQYVGMQTCRGCHENIYQTFIETGMGKSFDVASKVKSAGHFGSNEKFYDKVSDFWYQSYWSDSSMFIHEWRMEGKDTVHSRREQVNYIIGSGQHTNSHIMNRGGYLHQMPMTFYTQEGRWDLPPGFENGFNTHFSRKIGLECMSCHNSLPQFVQGSENKFEEVPNGIGCERCHGPGSLHVQEKRSGKIVDTSKYIDYTIVNPGKLSPDLQFDVCQRCHLQGNAVLHPGRSFYDFRPGMPLSNVMTVFMPKYEGAEDQFIMASHAERLKMSACFMITEQRLPKQQEGLRPAKGALTCVTCHNPHVSVKSTNGEHFNAKCNSCHGPNKTSTKLCSEQLEKLNKANNNCVSCHMPRSGAIDIPHVTVHDHFIRKPSGEGNEVKTVKQFLGLYAVNKSAPSPVIRARAFIQQYERFEQKNYYLDSAALILAPLSQQRDPHVFRTQIHLLFLQQDFSSMLTLEQKWTSRYILDSLLVRKSFDNEDAWTAYRIGEAHYKMGNAVAALNYYRKANALAPFYPDFKSKEALTLATTGKTTEARIAYQEVIDQNPYYVPALNNLGFLWLQSGNDVKAETYYRRALQADPDDSRALMNMAGLYVYRKNYKQALVYCDRVLKRNPQDVQALQLKAQIQSLK